MSLKEKQIPLSEYISKKLTMLQQHFKFRLTEVEIAHMESLTSEITVDNYAHALLVKYL